MNPVEIEEAVTQLASEPFDRAEFPFQFLTAFGNKKTTTDRLRKGNSNQSDLSGGVLQRSNIHIATCAPGAVADSKTLVDDVAGMPIDSELLDETAKLIAHRRASDEGQEGVRAFLDKHVPSEGALVAEADVDEAHELLFGFDRAGWQAEFASIGEYLQEFGDRTPQALKDEQQRIAARLAN